MKCLVMRVRSITNRTITSRISTTVLTFIVTNISNIFASQVYDSSIYYILFIEPLFNDITHKWESLSQEDKEIQARVMATYAAMIEDQDRRTGEILDHLKEER